MFLLLCLPSGCGHPFGSLVSFVTFDRKRRWPLEGFFFFCVGASRVGVRSYFPCVLGHLVIAPKGWCQRFSLACHCSSQYPSPGFLCGFARGLGCATLLCLWLCAHLLSGLGFPMLPDCPSPSIRLWVYWYQWLIFSTGVPYLRDGVTPAGSRFVCPRS